MNTSLSWIKAYVPDLDVTAQEYTDAMTLSGTKVEGFEELDADLEKIVIGQIDKIEKHPDADKLVVCQVNVGSETVQIVTGAKNVFEGAKVPVVLDGGRVAGGHEPGQRVAGGIKIKKGKLRGVESYGMMCSIEELGSDTNSIRKRRRTAFIFSRKMQKSAQTRSKRSEETTSYLSMRSRPTVWTVTVLSVSQGKRQLRSAKNSVRRS